MLPLERKFSHLSRHSDGPYVNSGGDPENPGTSDKHAYFTTDLACSPAEHLRGRARLYCAIPRHLAATHTRKGWDHRAERHPRRRPHAPQAAGHLRDRRRWRSRSASASRRRCSASCRGRSCGDCRSRSPTGSCRSAASTRRARRTACPRAREDFTDWQASPAVLRAARRLQWRQRRRVRRPGARSAIGRARITPNMLRVLRVAPVARPRLHGSRRPGRRPARRARSATRSGRRSSSAPRRPSDRPFASTASRRRSSA